MKTRISQFVAALFFAFIIVAGNANATEFKAKASSHENNQETALELESWMMDENIWNTSDIKMKVARESNLEIENWMINQSIWGVQLDNLNVESWMIDENVWEVKTLACTTEADQDLVIENWMIDENIWRN
jgi:hypothetical protein